MPKTLKIFKGSLCRWMSNIVKPSRVFKHLRPFNKFNAYTSSKPTSCGRQREAVCWGARWSGHNFAGASQMKFQTASLWNRTDWIYKRVYINWIYTLMYNYRQLQHIDLNTLWFRLKREIQASVCQLDTLPNSSPRIDLVLGRWHRQISEDINYTHRIVDDSSRWQ